MTAFHKGQLVKYGLEKVGDGYEVQAIVRRVHRDGTVTVEARFCVKDGEYRGGYLGYRYRYPANLLAPY